MLKIFIADDDKTIRNGLRSIIERSSLDACIVGEAVNGSEALKGIVELKPDVLVTDIKMPVMDGVELVKQLSGLDCKLRTIVLSGFDEYAFVRETMKLGVVDYILKPVNKKALLDLLDEVAKNIEAENEKEKQLKVFSEKVSISMDILREKLFIDLIRMKSSDKCDYVKQFEEVGYELGECFILAVLGLDDLFEGDLKQSDRKGSLMPDFLWEQVLAFIENLYPKKYVLAARVEKRVVLLFTFPEEYKDNDVKKIYGIIESLKVMFTEKNGMTLTIGMSKVFNPIEKGYIAYHQAVFALERRFYDGKNAVIDYLPEKSIYNDIREDAFEDYIVQLLNYIDLADSHKVRREVEAALDKMRSVNIEPRRCRELIRWLVSRVSVLQREFAIAAEGYLNGSLSIVNCIDSLDTFSELKEYICKAFYGITEQINHEREAKSRRIIEQAKDFINKNYNQGINLKMVADHIYLNASYLSDLFKKETGRNFTDYLLEVRMKEAKKLLARPETKVYEVAEMVGYDDPTSFNRSFRKVVGVSPAEYKKLIK